MPAKDANNETWGIVLPQPALEAGGYGTIFTEDPTQYENCYLGEERPEMNAIAVNTLLDDGFGLTMNIPRLINLDTITPNSGNNTDFNVQNGQVLTGVLPIATTSFTNPNGSYRICIVDGATVTLSGVTINGDAESQVIPWAGLTCLGNATIILEGENKVNGFYYMCPGILPGGAFTTLTIKGNGSLKAKSAVSSATTQPHGAGIGCGTFDFPAFPAYKNTSCGNIRIEGGTIEATGGYEAAGIGTAGAITTMIGETITTITSTCGDITITGGTITATGGINAAGIGTGFSTARATASDGSGATSTCGNIIISGGTITATGGIEAAGSSYTGSINDAAGIGAGFYGYCHSIKIEGTSTGTATGAGEYYSIGGRNNDQGYCCPYITIFGEQRPITSFPSPYSWPSSKH